MITWNDMPMCECPVCGHKWQAEDWYNLDVENLLECPKCDVKIEITEKECTMHLRFEKAEDAEQARKKRWARILPTQGL